MPILIFAMFMLKLQCMNPNDNQPLSPDYLNQIAPQSSNKVDLFSQKPIILAVIGLAAVLVLFFVMMVFGSIGGSTDQLKHLAARLDSTQSTVIKAAPNLKSTKLRALNGGLKSNLITITSDLTPLFANEKVDLKTLDKKILSSESNSAMLARLEDARLNVVYDKTYALEMSYQLENTINLMKQIASKTSKKGLKASLLKACDNLAPIQQEFSLYNAANG